MVNISPVIENSWKEVLYKEFHSEYFLNLKKFLIKEKTNFLVFPPGNKIFEAYNICPFYKTKIVILGQDPYHTQGQANGLCFSVHKGIRFPPSLKNIIRELINDVGIKNPKDGDLTPWAKQGILLLNTILTVQENKAGSHQNKGWENFTDATIKVISEKLENVVFILWGNYAKSKAKIIDSNKHFILDSVHPSPFSANNGFFGSKHFSKANDFLVSKNKKPIDWQFGI